jgi:hypothetical protein
VDPDEYRREPLARGRRGMTVPSANRITLLRDADGDGVAETRSACSST